MYSDGYKLVVSLGLPCSLYSHNNVDSIKSNKSQITAIHIETAAQEKNVHHV